jgi:hypothetical protein
MAVRLNRGEYWLLAKAVEHNLPLGVLGLSEWPDVVYDMSIEAALNCRGHGLDTATLKRTLQRLAARGWIRLARVFSDENENLPADDALLDEALRSRPKRDFSQMISVLLTPAGGAAWEAFARPEWHRYVSDDYEDLGDDCYERCIVAGNERLLKHYLHALKLQHHWEPDTEVRRERSDWQPIYWKPPFTGFECRFRYREGEPPLGTYDNAAWWRRELGGNEQCRLSRGWCRWS